jgi:hypothetical protein
MVVQRIAARDRDLPGAAEALESDQEEGRVLGKDSYGRPRTLRGCARAVTRAAITVIAIAAVVGGCTVLTGRLRVLSPCASDAACPCWFVTGDGYQRFPCSTLGVTVNLAVTREYAVDTRTVVEIQITEKGGSIPHGFSKTTSAPTGGMLEVTLLDAQGHVFPAFNSGGVSSDARFQFSLATGLTWRSPLYFAPLPQSLLQTPQSLTLRATALQLSDGEGDNMALPGVWRATYKTSANPGRSITFNIAPQIHGGVTVQPLRLDSASGAGTWVGEGAGERLLLRVSGLNPSAYHATIYSIITTDGLGLTTQGATSILLANQLPSTVFQPSATASGSSGPAATVELELIYLNSWLLTQTHAQTLSVNAWQVNMPLSSATPPAYATGPWTFTLPLS